MILVWWNSNKSIVSAHGQEDVCLYWPYKPWQIPKIMFQEILCYFYLQWFGRYYKEICIATQMAKRQDFCFASLPSELVTLTALGPQSLVWHPSRNSGRRSCQTADVLDEVFGFNKSSHSNDFLFFKIGKFPSALLVSSTSWQVVTSKTLLKLLRCA